METPSRLLRLTGAVRRLCASPKVRTRLVGALCGGYVLVWCHAFVGRWGTSLPAIAGLAAGVALGLELGWWFWLRSAGSGDPRRTEAEDPRRASGAAGGSAWTPFALHLGLAGWTVALPWLVAGWSAVIARVPAERLATPAVAYGVMLAGGVILLAAPMFLLAGVGSWVSAKAGHDRFGPDSAGLAHWLGGLAAGLMLGVFVVAPWIGLEIGASLIAIAGAVTALAYLMRGAETGLADGDGAWRKQPAMPTRGTAAEFVWTGLVCCALGVAFAAGQRVAHQLMPAAAYTLVFQWAALLLGMAVGFTAARRRLADGISQRKVDVSCCWWGAAVLALVALAFPLLVDFVLLLNSHVASVWMLMTARSLVAGFIVAPAGVCAGVLLGRARQIHGTVNEPSEPATTEAVPHSVSPGESGRSGTPSCDFAGLVATFASGLLAARLVISSGIDSSVLVIAAAGGLAILGTIRAGRELLTERTLVRHLAGATACALPVLALLFHHGDHPARAARLLFSTNVFLARQAGLNTGLLAVTDDARLVGLREGQRGTYTLWKLRGAQFQLRESGVPRSVISGDPRICPQYPPEIMQAVLPLVLHDRPSRVLLLGIGSGTALSTSLRFPVLDVTLAEGDAALIGLLERRIWNRRPDDPLADARVSRLPLDPPLAVVGRPSGYDVIISNADQSALLSSSACFTAEFYRNAARQLNPDGIFCQRFQAIDYGAQPLAVLARTLRAAFRSVVFVETGAGEYALLGTNSADGLVRDGLVERVQAPQVQSVLAEAGWDWSMLLNLNAFADAGPHGPAPGSAGLAEFAEEAQAGVNTAANGTLAYRLPPEIIRWAPKSQEVQTRLGPHATRLLAWGNVDGEDPDLGRRLSEVSGQRNIAIGSPDQYWAYRKTVRDQITERPRSLIVPVKGDVMQSVHPVDQRRLDYFEALGDALRRRPPRLDDIRHVAEFAVPFDPLLSYFLHQEVAELYARLPERNFAAELPHRLHAIYFADGQDRSVRNVAAVMELIAENPEAVPDHIDRWDHLNGLLQMMQLRWQNRGAVPPKSSRIVLNDIEQSIAGVEAALEAMDEIALEHDVPHADWTARRKYVERTLLRPLRTYRSQVLPHHLKRQRLAERTGQDVDAPEGGTATN